MLERRFVGVLAAGILVFGCRYSSSETPPPLEPDFGRPVASSTAMPAAGGAGGEEKKEPLPANPPADPPSAPEGSAPTGGETPAVP